MNFPVFDLHCDTALGLIEKFPLGDGSLRKNQMHIDLERAKTLPGYVQCFACFTYPEAKVPGCKSVVQIFEKEMDTIHQEIGKNSDLMAIAYSPEEVKENLEKGLMSGILTIEGPAGFDFDPALLEDLYNVGFRITSLSWNEKNSLTGSHVTGGGLTEQGREYVREAQRVGMLVDVSHISDEGFWGIMDVTDGPVVATHSNSRAVFNVSRNLTDDMFKAICHTGGVAGLNLYSEFIGENPDLDKACDHIFHFMELDPDGKHISLGGDLDGCDALPAGFEGVQDYPKLSQRLLERGLSEKIVHQIFWSNAVEVMERAVCHNAG